jgi:hypothetical protein
MKSFLLLACAIFASAADHADDVTVAAAAMPFGGGRGDRDRVGGGDRDVGRGGRGDHDDHDEDRFGRGDRHGSPWETRGRPDFLGRGIWHKLGDLGGMPRGYYCPDKSLSFPVAAPGSSGWSAPLGAPAPQCFCPVRQQLGAPTSSWSAPPLQAAPPGWSSPPLSAPPPGWSSPPLSAPPPTWQAPPLQAAPPTWSMPPLQAPVPLPVYYAPPPLQEAPPTWASGFRRLRGEDHSARAPTKPSGVGTKGKPRARSLYYDEYGRDIGYGNGGTPYPPANPLPLPGRTPALQGPIICICPY